MRVSRIIEVGAKWQAASVRSQVMGLGKWAAVRGGSYSCWDVPVFVFSDATDWRRTQKCNASTLQKTR
jgi:hypothetical protein